jgi:hypothetical protein
MVPSGQMLGGRAAPLGTRSSGSPLSRRNRGDTNLNRLALWAGRLLGIGSSAMILGGLLSWNLFRVGDYHFYGKVVLTPGSRLTVLILGVVAGFEARSVLLEKISPMRKRRYWASVAATGLFPLYALIHYADTVQGYLERWVVDTYASTIAAHGGTSVASVKNALRGAIQRHDVNLTLRPGFFIALAGCVVVLAAAALLLVDARRSAPISIPASIPARGPGEGLRGVISDAEGGYPTRPDSLDRSPT